MEEIQGEAVDADRHGGGTANEERPKLRKVCPPDSPADHRICGYVNGFLYIVGQSFPLSISHVVIRRVLKEHVAIFVFVFPKEDRQFLAGRE